MDIVRVRSDDLDDLVALNGAIAELHVQGAPRDYRMPSASELEGHFTAALVRADTEAWLARTEGEAVGFAILVVREINSPFLQPAKVLVVDQISVDPAWQRRGVGRRLMAQAEERAAEQGCGAIELNVAAFNEEAQAFYARLGYLPRLHRLWRAVDGCDR